jgi:hypothetical protein
MDDARKKAYRYLLYHAMLDIRLIQWLPRSWNPFRWRHSYQRAGVIADWLHNLAQFSALDFEGFDEDWFWREFRQFNERYPDYGLTHYQDLFLSEVLKEQPRQPDDHFAATIEELIGQLLADSSPDPNRLRQVASRSHILPLLLDWGGCFAVRPSGEIVSFAWDTPDELRVEVDPRIRNMAIYQGSEKYPALREFIPTRPIDAVQCPHCQGKGKPPEAELIDNLVCYCGGLGWLPPGSSLGIS